jgi:hypothetical protein
MVRGKPMGESLVAWLGGEVFSLGLGEAVRHLIEKRAAAAREILQEELSRADISPIEAMDRDEAAAMVFGYAEAARQGAGRRNLRMLAQILAGAIAAPPVYASEFLRWSRILADLTTEEIIVLAECHRAFKALTANNELAPNVAAWNIFKSMAADFKSRHVIGDAAELETIFQALVRTGLVIQQSGATGGALAGGTIYTPSDRLDRLIALIRIDDVLAEIDR